MTSFGFDTTAEEVVDTFADRVKGRTFLITGTSAKGLGAYTTTSLARQSPAHLILVSRTKSKADSVIQDIQSINPTIKTTFVPCDLADFDSVRKAADTIMSDTFIPMIDVIINNAGLMAIKEYTLDKQGNEMQLSANHLGHFLLTNLILPKLHAAGPRARVVNLTSIGYEAGRVRFDDPNFSGGKTYEMWSAYGQAKTATLLFSRELAHRGVTAFAVHPGSIMGTELGRFIDVTVDFETLGPTAEKNTGKPFAMHEWKPITQGTATTLTAALNPELEANSGAYMFDCQIHETYDYASDPENAKRLWTLSEKLVGQKFALS